MSEQEKQENQKTIVAFAAGLLIGGLLVWVFNGATPETNTQEEENATTTEEVNENTQGGATSTEEEGSTEDTDQPVMQTGEGSAEVEDQPAGSSVALQSATFPSDEGWIGVRDYVDGQIGGILGVARFSKEQGLVPQEIILQRPTKGGSTYAIVFFSENGDRIFNVANDVMQQGIAGTFVAAEK